MRAFDIKLWKRRAEARHAKNSNTRLTSELQTIENLYKVIQWCDKKSLKVRFGRCPSGGLYEPLTKLITVNSKFKVESQLFMLLHEIGHYLIGTCGTSKHRTSRGYVLDTDNDGSIHYKVDVLEEEYEAWDRGRKLATKRLKLDIDLKNFNKFKVNSIKTYLFEIVNLT